MARESADRLLPSTSTIAIYYYYLARMLTLFYCPMGVEGWVNLRTAVRVCSPCPRLYIAVAVVINTTAHGEIWIWVLSHHGQACYHRTTALVRTTCLSCYLTAWWPGSNSRPSSCECNALTTRLLSHPLMAASGTMYMHYKQIISGIRNFTILG